MSRSQFHAPATLAERIDFVIGFLRRRYLIILVPLVLCLPLAALYLLITPPTYTASAVMMIEPRKNLLQGSLLGDVTPDANWVESQIVLLKSTNVAAYVVKQLRLADDPGFIGSEPGLFAKFLARVGWRLRTPIRNGACWQGD